MGKILASISLALFTQVAFAALDENVFIQGKISNAFDDNKVKVSDSHGQKFWLPKSVFPKKFKFREGAVFNIEVPEEVMDKALGIK